jgi:hypothetical protein
MHNISYFLLIAGLFIFTNISSQTLPTKQSDHFAAPLDIPLLLSSNYGEYRSGHFHAGLDFKTQQVEGKNVLAVDSGYVYRVVVLEGSYGNAVYLKHPSGYITLYGHLSKFEPALAEYVKDYQYRKKSYTIDLMMPPHKLIYRKGEFIGLSGNSGSSFGAHLHFEIRDTTGAIPLNPLNYGFAVKDNISPRANWLMIYPMEQTSYIGGIHRQLLIQTAGRNNNYTIRPDTIQIAGKIGLGVEAYDFLDNALNECGTYTLQVLIDNTCTFFCRIDSIPFSDAAYINSYMDYGEMMRSGKKIQKLFIDKNNKLTIYKIALNKGVIGFEDASVHSVCIIITDTYGNESRVKFHLQPVSPPQNLSMAGISSVNNGTTHFLCDTLNIFENQSIRVAIPKDALFTDIDFQYCQRASDSIPFSLIHEVHNPYTPLFNSCVISIKPRNLPESLHNKALIARRSPNGTISAEGGEFKNGFVSTRIRSFGQFVVVVDTAPPVIKTVQFKSGAQYKDKQVISFNIADSLSGIRKYAGFIDKKWALFEYDAKTGGFSYTLDNTRIDKGKMHQLEIFITDRKSNVARYKNTFYY